MAGLERNRKLSVSQQRPSKACKKIFVALKKLVSGLELEYRIDRLHVDLALPKKKLAVELDGWAHRYFPSMKARDRRRDGFLKRQGWKVLRVELHSDRKSVV